MAELFKRTVVKVFTTPKELRKLADKMEEKVKATRLGESLTVETWTDAGVDVEFIFAQEKRHEPA